MVTPIAQEIQKDTKSEASAYIPIEANLKKHLLELLKLNYIDDITIIPPLIQKEPDTITGKIFLDVHINQEVSIKNTFTKLGPLVNHIKDLEGVMFKLRVRITTDSLYEQQNKLSLYPFPLEPLFREKQTYSLAHKTYRFNTERKQIILASIHFLNGQFMRFRSLQQKTDLIGSKFIKSLNLMYKYYLLSEYLKGHQLKFETNEKKIRDHLTPQFSEIAIDDVVQEEDWKIIKAQLKFLLKSMREELVKHDPGLKVLRF